MPKFVCIGAPYFLGERLPQHTEVDDLRASGLAARIGAEWVDLAPDFAHSPDPITAVNRALADAVAAHRDAFPIIFASDCTSALGAVKGSSAAGALGVVWFDAHGDFNTPETSPSGFIGGMPLAMLVGRGRQDLMAGVDLSPLREADVILADARDLDPGERIALQNSAVRHLPDLRDLLSAPLPDKPLYIHLDVDVVNPADMPAMSYTAPGGPSLDETAAALRRVARDGHPVGLLLGLWNGALATDKQPLEGVIALVQAFVDELQRR
jgi:arginase